jgi:hypothetical protein
MKSAYLEKIMSDSIIPVVAQLSESGAMEPECKPRTRRTKKYRGGQKGNQNARKHGFYSGTLTPSEETEIMHIIREENIDPPIACIRVKLLNLLLNDPGNTRAITSASIQLTRYCRSKFHLDKSGMAAIRLIIDHVLNQYASESSRSKNK